MRKRPLDLNNLGDVADLLDSAKFKDKDGDGDKDRARTGDGARGLQLKYLNTQPLIRQAQSLYTLAKDDDDDHSGFAAFLLDLDRLIGKNGGRANHDDDSDASPAEDDGKDDDDKDVRDDADWK